MTQEFTHGIKRHAIHDQFAGEIMTQVMPSEVDNLRILQKSCPRFTDVIETLSVFARKDKAIITGLLSPREKDRFGFRIQWNVARLATFSSLCCAKTGSRYFSDLP